MNSFINFLKRNKLYSAVNLLGLSLSMAFVLLLAVYVTSQLSTDSFQKNADRIYVIAQKETLSSAYWLSRHMKANFPEIERSASYSSNGMQEYKIDGNIVNARTSYADSSFFDMFILPHRSPLVDIRGGRSVHRRHCRPCRPLAGCPRRPHQPGDRTEEGIMCYVFNPEGCHDEPSAFRAPFLPA